MRIRIFIIILFFGATLQAQNYTPVEPGRFDQGKMWTFENAPLGYFKEAYGLDLTDEWLEDVRKSALRFSSWCSASFISQDGLIMTNHHCSRSVVASVMKEGENFDNNGFYAPTRADERKVPDLYVDQLVIVEDVTGQVNAKNSNQPETALQEISEEYKNKDGWKDLVIETRTFYSGGKYSIYGFKRYHDIRLVLYPELALGYFGGDPDNFTYPRYNLDFTFFRAYDEGGNELHPENFYKFNAKGATENEPVFVVGNPGSTGRYQTMAQLYYQRDVSLPAILSMIGQRAEILMVAAEQENDVYKKDSISNLFFSLKNSEKAYTGRLKGMKDPYLMGKKETKEKQVRSNLTIEGKDPWQELENNAQKLKTAYPDVLFLSPNDLKGKVLALIYGLYEYKQALTGEEEDVIEQHKKEIEKLFIGFDQQMEAALFAALLEDLHQYSATPEVKRVVGNPNPAEKARELISSSLLFDEKGREKFFKLKAKKIENEALIPVADALVPVFQNAIGTYRSVSMANRELEMQIMKYQFELSGISSPPDATFSLRLADGVVKGYEYNGTTAPWFTTYFGLYDRHYSHLQKYPWQLPERWANPPMELLKAPLNFTCTADIIGGNSGSPVVNQNKEVVGLVFDGNIESLPGYFIFDDTYNRTVSVHTGGIWAALKYVYKADRLVEELGEQE